MIEKCTKIAVSAKNVSKSYRMENTNGSSLLQLFRKKTEKDKVIFKALSDISFDVEKGKMLGIVGPNGAGKSTLLKTIAGVVHPSSGSIVIDGKVASLLELGAGFHQELTGRENVYLNAAILGMDNVEVDTLIDDIVKMAGIGDFIDAPVEVYSTGMRARLGFAVAVKMKPDILLVDETIAVGDLKFYQRSLKQFERMVANGATVILVSHDLSLIEQRCDSVLWIEKGKVVAIGSPPEVIQKYIEHYSGASDVVAGETKESEVGSLVVRSIAGDGCAYTGAPCAFQALLKSTEPVSSVSCSFSTHHGRLPLLKEFSFDVDRPCPALSVTIRSLPLPPGQYAVNMDFHMGSEKITISTKLLVYPNSEEVEGQDSGGHLLEAEILFSENVESLGVF
jgi:ABC-type polysaccharide/polyol phosphate transport system ATPase subunit